MQDQLTINGGNGLLEVFDVSGKLLVSKEHTDYSVLNVSDYNSGSYVLKLTNEDGISIHKLIK